MRRSALCVLLLAGILAGCKSGNDFLDAPKALDKMSPEEVCSFYGHYRENPDLTPHAKEVATAQMRAKGCPNA